MQSKENILVFGELLLRLNSTEDKFISKSHNVSIFPGGSEANVAASLSQWKLPCSYVSCVPDNPLAQDVLNSLSDLGTDTSKTILSGDRLGLYFLLSANGLTTGQVVYDRKYSSFSSLQPGMIDWDVVMNGHTWFHWTALTPALNENMIAVCEEALIAARRNGLTVSVDLNYRSRLWDYGKEPLEVMPRLVQHCDVIMGNIWAANKMIGIRVDDDLNRKNTPEEYLLHANASAKDIFKQFPNCKHVANTFRFMDSPNHNLFYGTYHNQNGNFISDIYETHEVVDRIGSGDAFMAGLIFALANQETGQKVIERATKSGYLKLFVRGDFGDGSI